MVHDGLVGQSSSAAQEFLSGGKGGGVIQVKHFTTEQSFHYHLWAFIVENVEPNFSE